MVYTKTITITNNTTRPNATETLMTITSGLIWLLEVDFPGGCCGLAHIQIFDGSYQIFPASPGESFACDGITLKLDDLYYKLEPPYQLKIITWNEDTLWNHTLSVRVGLASDEAEMSRYIPALAFKDLEEVLASIITTQENVKQQQLIEMANYLGGT